MKILYLASRFLPQTENGTTKFIYNVSKSIQEMGNEVSILTYSSYADDEYSDEIGEILLKKYKYDDIDVIAIKDKNESKISGNDLKNEDLNILENLIMREKPDVVHMCYPKKMTQIIFILIKLKIPYIITLTDNFLFCAKSFLMNTSGNICEGSKHGKECIEKCKELKFDFSKRFLLAKEILNNAKQIITPSNFLKEMYMKEFDGIRINVMNHGLDETKVLKNNKHYNTGDEIVFGFTSVTSYKKGVYVLVDAFNRLKDLENVKLKIYGTGSEDLLHILRDNNNIELCGEFKSNDIDKVYNSFDVLICPSICCESYSFVINEAFERNIPVIASNIGAMPEFVKTGTNGFTFDVGDSNQLADIVRLIGNNASLLNSLKENIDISDRTVLNEANFYKDTYENVVRNPNYENGSSIFHEENKGNWNFVYKTFNVDKDIFDISELNNINMLDFDIEFINTFIIKIDYLKKKFGSRKIKYLIWGASNSGNRTRKLIELMLPNFELVTYVDKFKRGTLDNVNVFDIKCIGDFKVDYIFICTTPGKKEATKKMDKLGYKIVKDYMYGYGQ